VAAFVRLCWRYCIFRIGINEAANLQVDFPQEKATQYALGNSAVILEMP
jgi:hypothetical protein